MSRYFLNAAFMSIAFFCLSACENYKHTLTPQQYYDQSISDAAVASPEKILSLRPITLSDTVTVSAWVSETRLPCAAGQLECNYTTGADRIWVTLEGEVKESCKAWHLTGDPLRRRLEQLLGLPPDSPLPYRKVKFVTMQVPRDHLERPCFGVDIQDPSHPHCTLNSQQDTSAELKNYVQQQMASSYIVNNPKGPGYPFTRLGYTYDWNPAAQLNKHYGASEFLIMPNTSVKVIAITPTDNYCQ